MRRGGGGGGVVVEVEELRLISFSKALSSAAFAAWSVHGGGATIWGVTILSKV
jgi:hypothetical protein